MREVAASFGADPELLPILGELLAPVADLGSPTRRLAALLAAHGIGRRSRVLDLGCGKGALAIEVVRATGCRVVGIDGFAPLVEEARKTAARAGLARRCTFVEGDVREASAILRHRRAGAFDAVVMTGLWDVARSAPLARSLVRPGGVYLLDDAVRDPRHPGASEFADVPTRAEVARGIRELGDEVLFCRAISAGVVRASAARTLAALETAGAEAMRHAPAMRGSIRHFLRGQRRAASALGGPLRPIVVLARRHAGA